jgi:hypothetical protein
MCTIPTFTIATLTDAVDHPVFGGTRYGRTHPALPFDVTALRGLSEKLIASHHQNNYGGAVKRLNAIRGELANSVGIRQVPRVNSAPIAVRIRGHVMLGRRRGT